eukprot:Phypoly_transcript_14059.p1 GENE.Phypoly_transcript_14059~~Phypoly_transcript_14059.p1  ORF type:complete len:267 (-),score=28.44 Phypoly_transcript_14059:73-873(-)
MAQYKEIVYECNSNGIAKVTLNNPRVLNPLTINMIEEIRSVLRIVATTDSIKVLVITGAGRGFCSGANLTNRESFASQSEESRATMVAASTGANLRSHFHPMIVEMQNSPKLIIAQVNGIAAGAGFSLAMAADFRICATSASFLSAFIRIGLVPDCGLSYFLPRVVGTTRAIEIMTLGEVVPSQKALDWGIANKVVPDELLSQEVSQLATKLTQGPVAARGWTKSLVSSSNSELLLALENETKLQLSAASTKEFAASIQRFSKAKL